MTAIRAQRGRSASVYLALAAFWILMVALQVRRTACAPVLPTASGNAGERLLDGADRRETWLGIYHRESKIGYSYSSISREPQGDGYLLHNQTRLRITALGAAAEMTFEARIDLDAELRTRRFRFDFEGGDQSLRAEGRLRKDGVALTVHTGGERIDHLVPTEGGRLDLSSSVAPLLSVGELEPDVEYRHEIFDPVSLTTQTATVRLTGRDVIEEADGRRTPVYVVQIRYQDTPFTAWLTERGEVVRQQTPLGWELRREPQQTAVRIDEGGGRDLLAEVAVAPTGAPMPEDPRAARRLRVRLSGVDTAPLDLEGGPQRVIDAADGVLEVTGGEAPPAPEADSPEPPGGAAPWLRSTPFVAADAPAIVLAAEQAAGEADPADPLAVADALCDWVHRSLEKKITMSLPSALEVLRARSGDCNEHTTLFVALARARGIPARAAVGLAWHERAFYYHAWPEVWAAGRWVALDPTFGQRRADASRVRLIAGGLERQVALGGLIGRLQLEVIDVE